MLSDLQRQKFFIAARAAYETRKPSLDFDTWRKDEMERTVGVDSIKLVPSTGDAWLTLMIHFLTLAGETKQAYELGLRLGTSEKSIARHQLEACCKKNSVSLNYAAAILRRKYKVSIDDATDRQLWHIIFTINRVTSKRTKNSTGNPF